MQDHKIDIINTRKGCLGGSDAKMLQMIASLGEVPKSARKRLAVCKGLIEPEQFTNRAIEFGNYIEEQVFTSLKETDERWQSNPCLVSDKYSRPNVKCIDHVDFLLQDDKNKVLTIGECKATRTTFAQTRNEYIYQLCHHYLLGQELAKKLGRYRLVVVLCHYCTEGVNLEEPFEFDASRLTVKNIRIERTQYDLANAMNIVDSYLENLEYYDEDDTIPYEYLPSDVQNQFDHITTLLTEIKERENAVNEFKERLYEFLVTKNVKGIKCDAWSVTRVDPTTSVQFDAKRFLQDFEQEHPLKYKKIRSEYDKKVSKRGYVVIKIK